jgi:hypothetical protein
MRYLGFALILIGILMLVTKEWTFRTKEKLLDAGPIEINKTETKTLTWPWFVGGGAIVGGVVVLLVAGKRKNS